MITAEQRQLAGSMRGVGSQMQDMPEWKKHITGGSKASYGKKEKRSLLEQRQGLPIYKLKEELLKVSALFYKKWLIIKLETNKNLYLQKMRLN